MAITFGAGVNTGGGGSGGTATTSTTIIKGGAGGSGSVVIFYSNKYPVVTTQTGGTYVNCTSFSIHKYTFNTSGSITFS